MTDLTIRDLRVDDAPGLSDLFRRCYGDTYATRVFYDIEELRSVIQQGRLRSVVAVQQGEIVGHTGISVVHEGARACETGNTVVDPRRRGQGLLKKLGAGLGERVRRDDFVGYVHYPTTAHEIMQRRSVGGGGVETGVMLAYIPATTDYRAHDRQSGRLAATIVYQPFSEAPERDVYLPGRYADIVQRMYSLTGLRRNLRRAVNGVASAATRLQVHNKPDRGLLQLLVNTAGSDFGDRVTQAMRMNPAEVTHVDMPLDASWIHAMTDWLVAEGFTFCGLLPEFERCDLLRMQKIDHPTPQVYDPAVINPDAQVIVRSIRAEVEASS